MLEEDTEREKRWLHLEKSSAESDIARKKRDIAREGRSANSNSEILGMFEKALAEIKRKLAALGEK